MKKNIKIYEMPLLHLTIFLLAFGTVMLYSASGTIAINKFGWDKYDFFLNKHLIRVFIGLIAMVLIYNLNLKWIQNSSRNILFLSWFLILFAYISSEINDSTTRRFLIINGKNLLTTSDFTRFAIILFTANFIDKNKKNINNINLIFREYLPYFIITLLLIMFQPDFSSTFIISLIIIAMLLVAGLKIKYFNYLVLSGGISSLIILLTYPYAKIRLFGWLYDENLNPTTQMARATQAIYNGGFWGQGIGKSIIKEGFIAEGHTDFILPIIGEELGFIGILLLFITFFLFYFICIKICKSAPNIFCSIFSLGIAFNILFYFLINASYVVGILPPTGLAIPFISYGGSHTLFTLISVGILLNISKYSNIYAKRYFK